MNVNLVYTENFGALNGPYGCSNGCLYKLGYICEGCEGCAGTSGCKLSGLGLRSSGVMTEASI